MSCRGKGGTTGSSFPSSAILVLRYHIPWHCQEQKKTLLSAPHYLLLPIGGSPRKSLQEWGSWKLRILFHCSQCNCGWRHKGCPSVMWFWGTTRCVLSNQWRVCYWGLLKALAPGAPKAGTSTEFRTPGGSWPLSMLALSWVRVTFVRICFCLPLISELTLRFQSSLSLSTKPLEGGWYSAEERCQMHHDAGSPWIPHR